MKYDTIIVLDFGSQYNQLIVRRLREIGVYSELWPHNTDIQKYKHEKIKGIILSGGPQSVTDQDRMELLQDIWGLPVPILGICYGMQLMVDAHDGQIKKAKKGEYGAASLSITNTSDALLSKVPIESIMWMSHQDETIQIPKGWHTIASTNNCNAAAISCAKKPWWGIQFHPEVTHSDYGMQVLKNFAYSICNAKQEWSLHNYVKELKQEIIQEVGDAQVICGLSGGVDSAVTAALIQQTVGNQLHCIYVDHGLMRAGESKEITETFLPLLGERFYKIDASDRFFKQLEGIINPEEKRKRIGKEFIEVFNQIALTIGNASILAQGTLYTDIVESGYGGVSQTIKSHHNVGGLPKNLKFRLLEPLKKLYKDEVRVLGSELGLSDTILHRQPFPGPGLAIRVLGEVTPTRVELVRQTDLILRQEIAKANLDSKIWQYFTVLPHIQSVGIKGDQRSYSDAIIVRAICSVDGMTADVANIPFEVLQCISRRITNEIGTINRVLYDITDKPPATIEFE